MMIELKIGFHESMALLTAVEERINKINNKDNPDSKALEDIRLSLNDQIYSYGEPGEPMEPFINFQDN